MASFVDRRFGHRVHSVHHDSRRGPVLAKVRSPAVRFSRRCGSEHVQSRHLPQPGQRIRRLSGAGEGPHATGHRDRQHHVRHGREHVEASGRWVIDSQHGQQFQAVQLKITHPASAAGIEKYLSSGAVRSIGPKIAANIMAAYNCNTNARFDQKHGKTQEKRRFFQFSNHRQSRQIAPDSDHVTPRSPGPPIHTVVIRKTPSINLVIEGVSFLQRRILRLSNTSSSVGDEP